MCRALIGKSELRNEPESIRSRGGDGAIFDQKGKPQLSLEVQQLDVLAH